ncbi:MAG: hypothetical protein CL555_01650 [Algoriphagus sp.]|nr:hypothetical protein [Algoriphagus sp.]
MAKLWKNTDHIPWICDEDEQDFFASIGDYSLRVEQMDTRRWWWRVCHLGDPIPTLLNEHATCRSSAINLAEGVYFGHLAATRAQEQTYIYQLTKNRK